MSRHQVVDFDLKLWVDKLHLFKFIWPFPRRSEKVFIQSAERFCRLASMSDLTYVNGQCKAWRSETNVCECGCTFSAGINGIKGFVDWSVVWCRICCAVLVDLLSQSRKKLQGQVWGGLQTSPKFFPVGEIMWKLLRQIIPASTAAGNEILGSAPDSILAVTQPQPVVQRAAAIPRDL